MKFVVIQIATGYAVQNTRTYAIAYTGSKENCARVVKNLNK
jgi:hypothetical protein